MPRSRLLERPRRGLPSWLALAAAAALGAPACSADLFHDTGSWKSRCDEDASAVGCPAASSAGGGATGSASTAASGGGGAASTGGTGGTGGSGGSAPTCNDGMQNGDETGVDCGGMACPACCVPVPYVVTSGLVSGNAYACCNAGDYATDIVDCGEGASHGVEPTSMNGQSCAHGFEGAMNGGSACAEIHCSNCPP